MPLMKTCFRALGSSIRPCFTPADRAMAEHAHLKGPTPRLVNHSYYVAPGTSAILAALSNIVDHFSCRSISKVTSMAPLCFLLQHISQSITVASPAFVQPGDIAASIPCWMERCRCNHETHLRSRVTWPPRAADTADGRLSIVLRRPL